MPENQDYSAIEKKVLETLQDQFGKEDITIETNLVDDINADSLDQVETLMELEDQFEIVIPTEETDKYFSENGGPIVKNLINYIAEKKGVKKYSDDS